ncbi:hypothetical protein E1A91_D06G066600v1 [Gossypium mustelinum]|uniref:Uncharacterized protein n=1 Tax=Gossypium mustelinum TaxID=34275 RepID=A0A5D2UF44_GOSMU|nr:hypothetical protein E1A91_D06G066600v1 [Gossypium mustelinum]
MAPTARKGKIPLKLAEERRAQPSASLLLPLHLHLCPFNSVLLGGRASLVPPDVRGQEKTRVEELDIVAHARTNPASSCGGWSPKLLKARVS